MDPHPSHQPRACKFSFIYFISTFAFDAHYLEVCFALVLLKHFANFKTVFVVDGVVIVERNVCERATNTFPCRRRTR